MKHNRTKNFIKLGILLFGIAFFVIACTKDEGFARPTGKVETNPIGSINPADITTGTLNWEEFTRITQFDNDSQIFQNFDIGNTINSSNSLEVTTESESSDEHLLVDEIQMYNYNDVTTYTFVIVENNYGNTFRNLVLRTEDDTEFEAFIGVYSPTDAWLNADQNITPYQGQVNMFPFTGTYQTVVTESTVDCHFTIEIDWECDAGLNHPPGTPANICNGGAEVVGVRIYEVCSGGTNGGGPNDGGFPFPDPNNPSNGDGSGGNNGGNSSGNGNNLPLDGVMTKPKKPEPPSKDCQELSKNEENSLFNQYMQELEDNTANGENEKGFNILYLPPTATEPEEETLVIPAPNPNGMTDGTPTSVSLPNNFNRKAFAHNHIPTVPESLKVFSPLDIGILGEILNIQQNNPNSPLEVEQLAIYAVTGDTITNQQFTFALKIENSNSKLINYAQKYPRTFRDENNNEVENPNWDRKLYNAVVEDYKDNIKPSFSKQQQIDGFLNLIKNLDLGASLYEKNPITDVWEKLYLDENGVVKREPCN